MNDLPQRAEHGLALRRALLALGVAILVALASSRFQTWGAAILLGWDAGAAVLIVAMWRKIRGKDQPLTAELARMQDDSRATTDLILLAASVASILGVFVVLGQARTQQGMQETASTFVALGAIAAAWTLVHLLFTLHYAGLYYEDPVGGIDFHGDGHPMYSDFLYLAFTIGMTFQVSDTELTSAKIRATLLRHSLLSYVFGAVIVAITINVVAGLLGPRG